MKEREKEELEEEEEEEEQNGSRGVRGSSSRGREQEEEEEAQGPTRSPSSRHNQRRPRPPHRPAPCKASSSPSCFLPIAGGVVAGTPMGSAPASAPGRTAGRKKHENWMAELPPRLRTVPLHHLSIPGSHDTMTYCLNRNSPVSKNESKLLRFLDRVAPCIARPVVLKWSVTQELNVTEQLDCGIRYLDLRIAHVADGSEKNLHFVHMVYTTALVEDTLTEISEWLQQHPKEVVILACRNFEGMTDGLHQYLVSCIKNIFGDTLCPRDEFRSLQQLWERGYQVVVSYEDEETVSGHRELWPAAPYWWGDKVKADDLVRYLEAMKDVGRPDGLFVAGINLTENLQYVLAHPAGSLKKMTLPNLPRLEAWIRGQIPGPGCKCINIIAGDFVGLDDFVGDVIGLNEKLLKPWPGLRLPFVRSVAVTGRSPRAEHWTERLGEGDGIL
ncbi:PI-PLC X domain-containing protein 1 [Ornithorhynchus anatinus]|nr:PI-PLC X domain-containing protein 1 [Ornithorhynchus anatinus]